MIYYIANLATNIQVFAIFTVLILFFTSVFSFFSWKCDNDETSRKVFYVSVVLLSVFALVVIFTPSSETIMKIYHVEEVKNDKE